MQSSIDEIRASEEEIRQNAEELQTINESLEKATEDLNIQKEQVEKKNQYITSSINYAQRIQKSILPLPTFIDSLFPESFVLFVPKDILSGDFYWAGQKKSKNIICAIDCTGHGVPGAFMSLIVKNILDNIILGQNITEPDLILEMTHINLQKLLHQQENLSHESADISIVVVDTKNNILEFAGAKSSLYLIKNNELKVLKADKYSIGGYHYKSELVFTKYVVPIDSEIIFYLSTDGFKDQFDKNDTKKFSSKAFQKLIFDVYSQKVSLKEQEHIFDKTFQNWKGDNSQTDDILVMGVKIG